MLEKKTWFLWFYLIHGPVTTIVNMLSPLSREREKRNKNEAEDHWSYIAHLSAEDMLKSVVTLRSFKILNPFELDQGHQMRLTFGTQKASCTYFS